MTTTISWTDETWNVTLGCRRVSAGCENCYAERQANRFASAGGAYDGLIKRTPSGPRWSGAVRFASHRLADPLSWSKPRRVFVDSMSDLFYEAFTDEQIAAVFGIMASTPQHTFQILTKRPERMRAWLAWLAGRGTSERYAAVNSTYRHLGRLNDTPLGRKVDAALHQGRHGTWPLPNVWLGVSVEDHAAGIERIWHLIHTPAALRFLSCEPLTGPVDLGPGALNGIGWVIAGCESGPGARPCDVTWLRSIRDQCTAAAVPFFLKQAIPILGAYTIAEQPSWVFHRVNGLMPIIGVGPGSREKGRGLIELPYLDGVQHAAFPEAR